MAEWPRMPYLNDELREWIAAQLATLGVDEIALYAVDPQRGQDEERRVLVATEVGLIDGWYAPRGGSSARYGFTARLWPWQAVRGVDLRNETYRVWALEHRTRWWLRLARPGFEAETDAPELGAALCDIAKVCAVMAEPAGWQAAQEEVPVRREPLRVVPAVTPAVPPEAGTDVEMVAPTGRPAVPPPMVIAAATAPEPQPLRPVPESQPPAEVAEPSGEPAAPGHAAASEPIPEATGEEHVLEPPDAPRSTVEAAADARPDAMADGDGAPANEPEPTAEAAVEAPPIDAPPVAAASDDANGVGPQRSRERGLGLPLSAFRRAASPVSATNGSGVGDEEEVLNLGELGGAEESAGADARAGDPLGLRGPLNR
jgi:hypothetical protein